MRRLLLILCILFAAASCLSAQTQYYVSPTGGGNGLSAGSPSTFATIQTLIPTPLPAGGAVINAACGVYSTAITWTRDGDATHPIVIKGGASYCSRIVNTAAVAVQIGTSSNPAIWVDFGTIGTGFEITTSGSAVQCGGIFVYSQHGTVQGNWIHDITSPTTGCGNGTGGASSVPRFT